MAFVAQHLLLLALFLIVAAAAGTGLAGPRSPLALRSVLGLALVGQLLIALAALGLLTPSAIVATIVLALAAGIWRMQRPAISLRTFAAVAGVAMLVLPFFILALYPPVSFDETLYHLPFVRAMARSGTIGFLSDVRVPVFSELHEALTVPGYLWLGDIAPHLAGVAELILLAALLAEWPRQRSAGVLAAALLLGNPIVIQMATGLYVDLALALFIAAGFYCLDRPDGIAPRWAAAAGLCLGTACSVKYLGWYFAAGAFVFLLLFSEERLRSTIAFLAAFAAAVIPMTARIVALTGNPLFPFLGTSPWRMPVLPDLHPWGRLLRLFWDITFDRDRIGMQPPYSPFFALALVVTLLLAVRQRKAAFIATLSVVYLVIFVVFLPRDSRYLLSLLPLVTVTAACTLVRWRRLTVFLSLISLAAGLAYAGYRVAKQGRPPMNARERQQYLERHVPGYRALERRGSGRIYQCGAERLKDFAPDDLIGDFVGLDPNERVFHDLTPSLAQLHVRYLLVSKDRCPVEFQRLPAPPAFALIYEDRESLLWRVKATAEARP